MPNQLPTRYYYYRGRIESVGSKSGMVNGFAAYDPAKQKHLKVMSVRECRADAKKAKHQAKFVRPGDAGF